MASIPPELLDRLSQKLRVTNSRVYQLIQDVSNNELVERNQAALLLAARNGINLNKYSTASQRAELRSANARVSPSTLPIAATASTKSPKVTVSKRPKDNSVFVVHGRNEKLRKAMFAFLRALGLKPLEWGHALQTAKGANPYIGQILDSAMGRVTAVVVLFTPDDEARLSADLCPLQERDTEGKLQRQPRANVLFEAGLALGRHPEKTILVQVGKMREFSDISGKHLVRLTNDEKKRADLAQRLQSVGCKVDRIGTDWLSEGDFTL